MTFDSPGRSDDPAARADGWITPDGCAAAGRADRGVLSQVLAGLETFFIRDYGGFGYPLAFYHREAFWRGQLPLWNPLNNCGLPFLPNEYAHAVSPRGLIYLLLPLPWSLGIFCLAHLFLAGMGMYFWPIIGPATAWRRPWREPCSPSNGLTWHSLMWPNNIAGLGWMPWCCWRFERAWRKGGRRRLALAAFTGAMQMLTARRK